MRGATARYTLIPVTRLSPGEALEAIAAAAERISAFSPEDAENTPLLARLSMQLAEATAAVENYAARELIAADIRAELAHTAPGASRAPGTRRLAPVSPIREPGPSPRTPSPAP